MYKETKQAVRCDKCKSILQRAEGENFCDVCGGSIVKHNISLSFHFNKRDLLHFTVCSADCLVSMLSAKRKLNYRAAMIHLDRKDVAGILNKIEFPNLS